MSEELEPEEIEAKARDMGWVPEEEWKGDPPPKGFLSAEEFYRRGQETLPLIQSQLKKREAAIDSLKKDIEELKSSTKQSNEFLQNQIRRQQQENQQLIQQLEQQRANAISEGDGQAAVEAERQIQQLRTETPQYDPMARQVLEDWLKENEWYGTDPVMRNWADGKAQELKQSGFPTGPVLLNQLANEVKQAFPDRFNASEATPVVEGKGRKAGQSWGKRSFDDLPDEAKKEFQKFKDLIPGLTKKQYLEQYDWDE